MRVLGRARRQLLDAPGRERREIVRGALQRREHLTPRLIRERDLHVGAPRERLEQRPLRARQILEPVREDGLAVPRIEVGLESLGGAPAEQVEIPEREAVELTAVALVEPGQVSVQIRRVEQAGLELPQRLLQRVGESARARGGGQPVQRGAADRAPHDQRALVIGRDRPAVGIVANEQLEQAVERDDLAAEEAAVPREQVALDAIDVRRIGHDQYRLVVETRQIALEQERDFARVRRPGEEGQPHLPIVERPQDVSHGRSERFSSLLAGRSRLPLGRAAGGRGGRRHGPASSRRTRRRDRPPSSRGGHRNTSRGATHPGPRRPPCRSCHRRALFSAPNSPPRGVSETKS